MSELSDYKRMVERPMINRYEATVKAQRERITKLEEGLRGVVENCTLANQGHATSKSYRAIGLLAAKALSSAT